MEEVLPTGMERHPKTGMLWARKDVPARYTTPTGAVINLREIVGKRTLKRTLKTKDLAVARLTFHDVMGEFEGIIARAKSSVTGEFAGFGMITMTPNQLARAWHHTGMSRDTFSVKLACPKCDRTGVADVSQSEGYSFSSRKPGTRVELMPAGFKTGPKAKETDGIGIFYCESCDAPAIDTLT